MQRVGAPVATMEEIPVAARRLAAGKPAESDAGSGDAPALLADLLALVVRELREERLEGRIAGVAPVELHAAPLEHARRAQGLRFFLRGEEHVQGRNGRALRQGDQGLGERRAHRPIATKQARSRRGGEGHRRKELRVVRDAVPLVRIGPGPVEHVLAVRMALHVERNRARERPIAPAREILRLPAAALRGAPRAVQAVEERVRNRRVAIRHGIPLAGIDVPEPVEDLQRVGHLDAAL
jgi:hypothetical protein